MSETVMIGQPAAAALLTLFIFSLFISCLIFLYLWLHRHGFLPHYRELLRAVYLRDEIEVLPEQETDVRPFHVHLPDYAEMMNRLLFGLIYYKEDGSLLFANQAAADLLGGNVPQTTTDFLTCFAHETGLNAAFLLQEGERQTKLTLGERKLELRFRDLSDEEGKKLGMLLSLQDITESEALEAQRKQFVANVSHELKTPLTTIKTYSESLLDWGLHEKKPEAVRKDISRIYEDALRMEQLVADLLLLSSIDSRGMRYHMAEIDMTRLVHQLVERMRDQAEAKNICLETVTLSALPQILGDQDALERIISNLITNAIKYSDEHSRVIVYLSSPLDNVHVNVSDAGYGIAPQHIPHLFERFYRVDVTGNRRYGGTGLGLSIAKELVELHHGRIQIRSRLGKGSEFHLLFPSAGRSYADAMEAARENRLDEEDPLQSYAAKELLLVAKDLEMDVETLGDLSAQETKEILAVLAPSYQNSYAAQREELELLRKHDREERAEEDSAYEDEYRE